MVSTWWKRLKVRCVDCTNYVKIVHQIIIGNSMLNYATESLEKVTIRVDKKVALAAV